MNLIHTVYQPAGSGPHPAILTLHGRGANAFDLLGLAPHLGGGKFLMICPQGPLETPIGSTSVGYAWYPMTMGGPPDLQAMRASQQQLKEFVAECPAHYAIDPQKFVVLGFSQGGVMAYGLALSDPGRFAALAALSTWLPKELVPAAPTPAMQSLPILVQHGTQDQTIQVARAQDSAAQLRQWRLSVTYREYDMGHEISARSLSDLSAWLEERVGATGESPSPKE